MFSRVFVPLVKRRCLASLTLAKPHPLLYIITTNRSSFCMWRDSRLKHDGALVSASSVSVSPGVFCQDAQAVFLPHPRKCDIVSHPAMAWKSGNATDREGPRSEQISWMGISRSFFPYDANTADIFRFENQREPPSLADRGSLRTGKKSDIVECIKAPVGRAGSARLATVVVLDMAAVVHMVRHLPVMLHNTSCHSWNIK